MITMNLAREFAKQYDRNALDQIIIAADLHCEMLRETFARDAAAGTSFLHTDEGAAASDAINAFGMVAYYLGRIAKLAEVE